MQSQEDGAKAKRRRPSGQQVTQKFVLGRLAQPAAIGRLLVGVWFLMGFAIAMLLVIAYTQTTLAREIRIMGIDLENTNAIMIREGIAKPGDRMNRGPTDPTNLEPSK